MSPGHTTPSACSVERGPSYSGTVRAGLLSASVLALVACGGGGGGGGGPVTGGAGGSPPPVNLAALPAGSQVTLIAAGGTYDVNAGRLGAIQPPTDGGGTAKLYPDRTEISVASRGLDLTLRASEGYSFNGVVSGFQGANYEALLVQLDQMALGTWLRLNDANGNSVDVGAAVGGIRTPVNELPTIGSASYSGAVVGVAGNPNTDAVFAGSASLNANFANRTMAGTFREMQSVDYYSGTVRPFNSMSVNGSWVPGSTVYNGTVQTTNAPGGPTALPSGVTGTMTGTFFGAGANAARETGGTFLIDRGANGAVMGAFGARR